MPGVELLLVHEVQDCRGDPRARVGLELGVPPRATRSREHTASTRSVSGLQVCGGRKVREELQRNVQVQCHLRCFCGVTSASLLRPGPQGSLARRGSRPRGPGPPQRPGGAATCGLPGSQHKHAGLLESWDTSKTHARRRTREKERACKPTERRNDASRRGSKRRRFLNCEPHLASRGPPLHAHSYSSTPRCHRWN